MVNYNSLFFIGNTIYFLLYLPAALVNFKYYLDLKLKDNLLVGLYFLFAGLQVQIIAIAFVYNPEYWRYVDITNSIWLTVLFLIGVRIRWSSRNMPKIIYFILPIYLWHLFAAVLNFSFTGRGFVSDVYLLPFIDLITYIFVLYTIITCKIPLTITKLKRTRNTWILVLSLYIYAVAIYEIFIAFDLLSLTDVLWFEFYFGLLPQYIGAVIFFILHLFFPDAVLFSEEQLYRARKLYAKIRDQKPKFNQSRLPMGSSKIVNYLNSIPKDLLHQATRSSD